MRRQGLMYNQNCGLIWPQSLIYLKTWKNPLSTPRGNEPVLPLRSPRAVWSQILWFCCLLINTTCEISDLFCPVFCLSPLASTFALEDHSELFCGCGVSTPIFIKTLWECSRAETQGKLRSRWCLNTRQIFGQKTKDFIKIPLSAASQKLECSS